jgi:uncharacterized protein (DUF433 family)
MVAAPIHHIGLDERGIAYVASTSIKVATIAVDADTWGHTPAEIQENYPKLSLAQIHAALAYHYDHRPEIYAQLAAWDAEYEQLRDAHPNPLTRDQWEARRRAQQEDHCVRPR